MRTLITAALSVALGDSLPPDIVYIPEGSHKIFPTVNGKPKEITVSVLPEKGEAIAAALQADLEKRQAGNVRAWFDFEHKRGAASALPQSFRYEPGRGIVAAVEWTGAGRAAVEGKDFSYFSPEFLMEDDGTPVGLPSRGPLGALVNEPAFREIPRIAAMDAAHEPTDPTTPSQTMKLILASLAISAAAENAETEAVEVIKALKVKAADHDRVEQENKDLKAKVDAAEAEAAKSRKERAETLVKAAVADGRLLAKDDELQTKYRNRIAAGDTFAEDILAGLPKQHLDLGRSVVKAGQGEKPAEGGHAFEAKARALVTAGEAKTFDDALARVAASEPDLYNQYLGTLG